MVSQDVAFHRLLATLPPLPAWFYHPEEDREPRDLRPIAHQLFRTQERWSWFTQASTLDKERHTSFGTLGYLPFEIRTKIYAFVLNTQVRSINKHMGCFSTIPPWRQIAVLCRVPMWWIQFKHEACAFGCWNSDSDNPNPQTHPRGHPGPLNLRTYFSQVSDSPAVFKTPFLGVSHSLADEFSIYMLNSRNFCFNCPASFAEFIHTLRPCQRAALRRITIDLTGPLYRNGCQEKVPDPKAWATAFAHIPNELASLIHVTVLIGRDAPSFRDEAGNEVAWYQDEEDRVEESLLPLYGIDTVARILGIVCEALYKVAPKVEFFLPEYEYLNGGNQADEGYDGDGGSPKSKIKKVLEEAGIPPQQRLVVPWSANALAPKKDKSVGGYKIVYHQF